ncbi:diphthine--ammonia ligase [Oxyplasma meridianum]|uniref:Diphthine--ammonia ligase n=1 Tax=Oxyplasma meridianum TaxID=3073602 RepID=A0AAX4NFR0_9ARCH
MRSVSLFSGGKDSFLSAQIAMEQGFEIVAAITVIPEEFSYMFHYPNAHMSHYAASLLDLKVIETSENGLWELISEMVERDQVEAVISGAIASEYQKTRIEAACSDLGIMSFTPLWKKDQEMELQEIIMRGINPIIVSVSADGFDIDDLGMNIDISYLEKLRKKKDRYGINLTGEGGEYETFVTGLSPGKKVIIEESEKVWEGSHGYLLINKARITET